MHDSAFTGKTLFLDEAVTGEVATYGELMQAVLDKLEIFACDIPVCLQQAGKEMSKEAPLDADNESCLAFTVLTLTPRGLVGGSLSARKDIDDDFKRVTDGAEPIQIDTGK